LTLTPCACSWLIIFCPKLIYSIFGPTTALVIDSFGFLHTFVYLIFPLRYLQSLSTFAPLPRVHSHAVASPYYI
jgi:hypothetical protein